MQLYGGRGCRASCARNPLHPWFSILFGCSWFFQLYFFFYFLLASQRSQRKPASQPASQPVCTRIHTILCIRILSIRRTHTHLHIYINIYSIFIYKHVPSDCSSSCPFNFALVSRNRSLVVWWADGLMVWCPDGTGLVGVTMIAGMKKKKKTKII